MSTLQRRDKSGMYHNSFVFFGLYSSNSYTQQRQLEFQMHHFHRRVYRLEAVTAASISANKHGRIIALVIRACIWRENDYCIEWVDNEMLNINHPLHSSDMHKAQLAIVSTNTCNPTQVKLIRNTIVCSFINMLAIVYAQQICINILIIRFFTRCLPLFSSPSFPSSPSLD